MNRSAKDHDLTRDTVNPDAPPPLNPHIKCQFPTDVKGIVCSQAENYWTHLDPPTDLEVVPRAYHSFVPPVVSAGVELIAHERQRHIDEEGYSAEHDSEYAHGELALAAACYALGDQTYNFSVLWPWTDGDWKPEPRNRIHELVKAGALIAAEIDRLEARDA